MQNFDRKRAFTNGSPQDYFSNTRRNRSPLNVSSATSVHSQHLWHAMSQIQLFPQQIHELLKNEQRNINNYKKSIELQKMKINQQVENLKKGIFHVMEDMKISINAEMDNIYKFYITKYAEFKQQIMEIKKIKDQIEIDLIQNRRSISPKPNRENNLRHQSYSTTSNVNLMKSFEDGAAEIKKYEILKYINQLQKQKIMPLNELSRDLIILTEYENGYCQQREFVLFLDDMIDGVKNTVRKVYQNKYEFIRDPEMLIQKEEKQILKDIYDDTDHFYRANQAVEPPLVKLQSTFAQQVSPSLQSVTYDWLQNIKLSHNSTLKSQGQDIVLCALQIQKGVIGVGGRDGTINIYQLPTNKRIGVLKGHIASICTLALVKHQGKQYLASGSDHGCSSICLWDTTTWNMKMKIEGHKAAVTAIVDLKDNQSLISGSYDKRLNIYNLLNEGRLQYNLPTNKSAVTGIIINANATKIVSCGLDNSLNVWQIVRNQMRVVETMFLERIIQNNTMICSLVASQLQEDIIFIGAKDGKIKLINIDKGQAYKTIFCCNNAVIEMVVFERASKPDHPIIVCWPCKEQSIKILNTDTNKIENLTVRGYIQFGCGIGPKGFVFSQGKGLAMLSQSESNQQVNLFRVDIQK